MRKNPGFSIEFTPPPFEEEVTATHKVSVLDLTTLLMSTVTAKKTPRVGFEDADRTYTQLVGELGKHRVAYVKESTVESALWCANLLNEKGLFEHPTGRAFDSWVEDFLSPHKFDRLYNLIIRKGK